MLALPWPSFRRDAAPRDERDAWLQVLRVGRRAGVATTPVLVVSHAPPRGAGDAPTDPYHVGFDAYRLVARRPGPPLWLHGHTNPAAHASWRTVVGPTTFANATESILVELVQPDA
jgi:Icc-related predicted phosphoesterase